MPSRLWMRRAQNYIGSDSGTFYCLNTSDGSVAWSYTVPTGTDKRIRSGASLDPNNPLGSTVYFHCNNGYLYALNANTGGERWNAHTANEGGPPTAPDPRPPGGNFDPQPVSSSPVVDSSGVVYVGSADGSVYAFNPSTGAQNWRVVLNSGTVEPVEATIAIGQNGVLYVGSRVQPGTAIGGTMYAINPVTHAVLWPHVFGGSVGFIASPVIDQSGFIYASHFDGGVLKLNPADGTSAQGWSLSGKLCQTPTINQNGLLIIGVSALVEGQGEFNEVAAIKTGDTNLATAFWAFTQAGGQPLGSSFGSPAILCDNSGSTYVADTLGHVIRFVSGAPMMAGAWPTFECGNRRAGKSITYPAAIAELPAFYFNSATDVYGVDLFGRAVGQAYGYYDNACGFSDVGYAAALWRNNSVSVPGGCTGSYYLANTYANAINAAGDVVGYYASSAIAWPDGANSNTFFTTLLEPTGFTSATAYDINDGSTIVGYGTVGANTHVLRWEKTGSDWPVVSDLNAPAGGQASAYAITDDGRIVGKATFTSGGPFHAFNTQPNPIDLSELGVAHDLGTMGGTASEAWDMHDVKGTVGRSQIASGYWRGFLLPLSSPNLGNSAVFEICGLPGVTRSDWNSAAYGVNKFGQVVGYAQNQSLASRAVRYSDLTGTTIDLNTLVLDGGQTPASLGWTLTSARAINDAGVMVGAGVLGGYAKSWIIYPKCQD